MWSFSKTNNLHQDENVAPQSRHGYQTVIQFEVHDSTMMFDQAKDQDKIYVLKYCSIRVKEIFTLL